MAIFPAFAQQYDSEGDFKVEPDSEGKGLAITAYLGSKKEVRIPPRIQNKPVTKIGDDAFRDKKLTSVTIPNNVTSIESGAFCFNQLTSVTIPDSVKKIGEEAFIYNPLTSVTITDSFTRIMKHAFGRYGGVLTSITISSNLRFDEDAFGYDFYYNYIVDYNRAGGTYIKTNSGEWRSKK